MYMQTTTNGNSNGNGSNHTPIDKRTIPASYGFMYGRDAVKHYRTDWDTITKAAKAKKILRRKNVSSGLWEYNVYSLEAWNTGRSNPAEPVKPPVFNPAASPAADTSPASSETYQWSASMTSAKDMARLIYQCVRTGILSEDEFVSKIESLPRT